MSSDTIRQCNILLMTATVMPPPGVPNLQRRDPQLRMDDYRQALKFYMSAIGNGISGIVFAENSRADLTPLVDTVREAGLTNKVEFVSCYGLDYPPAYDRGYGEFKLLDYAMNSAQMLHHLPSSGFVWKVTGRYIVQNLTQIVAESPHNSEIYCNFRNFPIRLVDMYMLRWSASGYRRALCGIYSKLAVNVPGVRPGTVPEQLLREHLDEIAPQLDLTARFSRTPELVGIRGGDNLGYSTSNRWKFVVRRTAQITVPALWI